MKKQLQHIAVAALVSAVLASASWAQSALIDGTVTKVDAAASKITIKHGPIKKFDMDEGMTMVFTAKDKSLLGKVKAGDKVKFDADNVNGQFIVTAIEKAK
ncbi:MAG: copper-binding protein [Pseudolabrys sp.]|nr:copper-binding protein [Pseudolabrys sp.]MCW5695089.1 copper-binding protein [Pseudolabrys sp.]